MRRTWRGRARRSCRAAARIKANVFTRILLALYGETSWANVPTVPVELILLPRWFPIHLSKMSYWARTVIVPLLVLAAQQPRGAQSARHPCAASCSSPGVHGGRRRARRIKAPVWSAFFGALDWVLKRVEPLAEGPARSAPSTNACAGRPSG